MIEAARFIDQARGAGFDFYAGVPCSFLTPLINRVISDRSLSYIGATSEGEAVGIAAGAWLAGRSPVVMCQNSGLGNMVNPLTSLNWPFRIPILLIITWRGQPGLKDEPQHVLMGQSCTSCSRSSPWHMRPFPRESDEIVAALAEAAGSNVGREATVRLDHGAGCRRGRAAACADSRLGRRGPMHRSDGRRRKTLARRRPGAVPCCSAGGGGGHRDHRQVRTRAVHTRRSGAAPLPGRFDGLRERHGPRHRLQRRAPGRRSRR